MKNIFHIVPLNGMYFIKNVCQVFSHTDQFFQYRQILYGYKPINKLKEISVETEI